MDVLSIFGPTSSGKTELAIAVAETLRRQGEDPVAVSCDAIQVYRGLEIISGAATTEQRSRLEHRLIGFVDPREEFSAGQFAALARAEIDALLAARRRPIVVGGTGLYMRAALAELDLRPPVEAALRRGVEEEIAERGAAALHTELPSDVAEKVNPNDAKRVSRATELIRAGQEPAERSGELWTTRLRRPTLTVAILADRGVLEERINLRVDAMVEAGVTDEIRRLEAGGISRTAKAALGFEQFLADDVEGVKTAHRRYARRQLTWLRKMGADLEVEQGDGGHELAAAQIVAALRRDQPPHPPGD